MRPLIFLMLLGLFYCVTGKGGVKALTEQLGQEIIEIGTPVKDLPPELEEEPSAEADDDYKQLTAAPVSSTTKKEVKKITTTPATRRAKDMDVSDEDDVKIEKELAEMYKDNNIDYKDSFNTTERNANTKMEKAVPRMRSGFKFQPDINNAREVEKFRTSIDDINCDQTTNKLNANETELKVDETKKGKPDDAVKLSVDLVLYTISLMLVCW